MKRLVRLAIPLGIPATLVLGCASGQVDGELRLFLEDGNLDYYEEVLFPADRRATYDEIFAGVPLYLPFYVDYSTARVDALITQRGDLQITSHLTAGQVFRDGVDAGDYEYLADDAWNGESDADAHGEALREELTTRSADYRSLDEDLRLILLVNLPDPGGDDLWPSDDWEYPVELVANYQETYVDEEDQEYPIPEDEIELMARMIIGGELFETIPGTRLDEVTGLREESVTPNMTIDALTMPGEDGRLGHLSGRFDLYLEASAFRASSGIAVASGELDVDVHVDRWAMEDLEEQEDLEP